jgi:RNA polymerase sigma-70 factor
MLKSQIHSEARAVFEILVRENQAMLMTYLRAVVRDSSAIDDLFQETMLIAWRRIEKFDRSLPFGPWLRGIAAKLMLAHFRKARAAFLSFDEQTLEYLGQQVQSISERPGDTWDDKIAPLNQCIEQLPDSYRQAIQLRYFEHNSVSQVASRAGDAVETIKKRLQRARAQLLDCLRRKKVVAEIPT